MRTMHLQNEFQGSSQNLCSASSHLELMKTENLTDPPGWTCVLVRNLKSHEFPKQTEQDTYPL